MDAGRQLRSGNLEDRRAVPPRPDPGWLDRYLQFMAELYEAQRGHTEIALDRWINGEPTPEPPPPPPAEIPQGPMGAATRARLADLLHRPYWVPMEEALPLRSR